jgi:hypothetical protein
VDVQPDIQLGPIRKREDADAFAFIEARIEYVPKFRPLILGVPLAQGIAERIDAFFRARFFFVAARSAEGRVETAFGEGVK